MKRKQWMSGAILLVLLLILCISGSVMAFKQWQAKPAGSMGQRDPLPAFGYCSSRPSRPCIMSFNLDPEGGMLINILTDNLSDDFYMKIRNKAGEQIYECRRTGKYSRRVVCTGDILPVGETMSFLLIAKEKNTTLAQGSFPIIGLALATPEISITPTPFTHQGPH